MIEEQLCEECGRVVVQSYGSGTDEYGEFEDYECECGALTRIYEENTDYLDESEMSNDFDTVKDLFDMLDYDMEYMWSRNQLQEFLDTPVRLSMTDEQGVVYDGTMTLAVGLGQDGCVLAGRLDNIIGVGEQSNE